MWCIVRRFSGGLGSAGSTVGLDLKDLFQPKRFHESYAKQPTGCNGLLHFSGCYLIFCTMCATVLWSQKFRAEGCLIR